MRRYVQTERVVPTKKSKRSKRSSKPRPPVLTYEEIQSLPASMRDSYVQPTIIQPSKSKITPIHKLRSILDKENGCVESTFINSRAPGSKILNHRRQSKQPLYTFDDRLSRTNVVSRDVDSFTFRSNKFELIIWTCHKDIPEEVNMHLVDHDEPEPVVDTFNIIKITLVNESDSKHLLDTPAGRVCPKCQTNEFIKSDLKNMPITYQDKHWRDLDSYGEHCQCCQTNSI